MRGLFKTSAGRTGAALLGAILLLAIFAPLIATYDPLAIVAEDRFLPPCARHLLGTDEFGHDILSRVLIGSRHSLATGFGSILIALFVGVNAGLVSGFFGGLTDAALTSLMNAVLAFPAILLAVVVLSILGPSGYGAALAIAIVCVPGFARLTRANVISEKGKPYVEAERVLGARSARLMYREILPNVAPPLLVQAASAIAGAVLLESALSFLGLGAPPPAPAWGSMLSSGKNYLAQAPWYAIAPGLALSVLAGGLYLLGDGIRESIDPRSRRKLGL